MITQFEKMATNYRSTPQNVAKTATVTTRGGEEVAETAGMLKKKTKKKKEKTLGAKLRLKEKKTK
jgi:hypothetical protein